MSSTGKQPETLTITADRPANGGASVGRDSDGRTVFCTGALPGETVEVAITEAKKRFARGRVENIVTPSADRIEPTCPTRLAGCGGCDLAHATIDAQRRIKAHVVRDSLERIGKIDRSVIEQAWLGFVHDPQPGWYRTTARLAVCDGRLGYRRASSHSIAHPASCGVVHPQLENIITSSNFDLPDGSEAVVRVSNATGEAQVVVDASPDVCHVPDGVVVVRRTDTSSGEQPSLRETAAGRSWVVSAASFFQAGPDVATALVEAVSQAAGPLVNKAVVDAYCGVGLFGGALAVGSTSLTAIESSDSSIADARINLADPSLAGTPVTIEHRQVETWRPHRADVVIADPARAGLARKGVSVLTAAGPERFVLVSCDTGSMGRDAGLLIEAGYKLRGVYLVDAFRDTSHVEVITAFDNG